MTEKRSKGWRRRVAREVRPSFVQVSPGDRVIAVYEPPAEVRRLLRALRRGFGRKPAGGGAQ